MIAHHNLGILAGIINLIGFVPYGIAIVQGRSKPNLATWSIWFVVGILLASSYWASGATHTIWAPLSYVIGPLVTAILAWRYGDRQWSRFDRLCMLGAAVSLVLWLLFRKPQIALVINIIIDLFGALPTLRNARRHPQDENLPGWLLFGLGNGLNILAVDRWTWEVASYPLYMGLITTIVLFFLLRPRRKTAL